MGKVEKIITACGILTPAEYNKVKTFCDEQRNLFDGKAKTAIYDAVVAGGKIEKDIRLENVSKLENQFSNNKKISAALSTSAYAKPANIKVNTRNKTRKEIREFC
ncbi:MAG: hypothetical protein J5779_01585 [Clostridia bacterium]|nr:hypothetical protein [Clostridia bacterium]